MSETVTQVDQAAIGSGAATRPEAATPSRLRGILCLEDFEEPARRFLPRPIFGFINGGVESNSAREGNRAAFSEYHFLPRVLVNTRARHQRTTFLGRTYDLPFGFPPMGGTALAAAELLRQAGAVVDHALFVIDLPDLAGADALRAAGVEPWSLVDFLGH